ncbi:MAG: translation initiation factor IF-2 [Calditrichaceae bacterium]
MAVGKKYKLFKICKELNLGHETISDFLQKKGIKVAGPNTPIDEEIYIDILEKFATDKAKAEVLKARKESMSQPESALTEETDQEKEVQSDSAYMKAIKKSIADGAEALSKPPVDKKKAEPKKKKDEIKVDKPAVDEGAPYTKAKKPKKVVDIPETKEIETVSAKEEIKTDPVADISDRKQPDVVQKHQEPLVEAPVKAEDESRVKKSVPGKDKEKKKTNEEDAFLSEKEKKRRKALEMIRKDGKKRPSPGKVDITRSDSDGEGGSRKRKSKKPKRKQVDLKEVQDNVKKTLASIDSKGRKPKRHKKIRVENGEEIEENIIKVTEFISASDLANMMDVSVAEIITKCLELGLVVSINQRLDLDTITLLAEEYGFKVEEQFVSEFAEDEIEEEEDDEQSLKPRAPIVTIMGHVDHGKTSLLDFLRHSNIVSGEAGGITQHIGAYEVEYNEKRITFLDTPGHEAFTAMRARGAQVTDIVILIIAADDAVMPQTDEALDHAKAAGVKIVIAINKIDKPGANSERIKQQLAERNVLVEDWGGTYQCAEISAKLGKGIPELLEKVLLEAEMLDLKANPDRNAAGHVVEARLDKGKGAIATVLIQNGTLKVGDNFIAGQYYGKVRALFNESDDRIKKVGPSQPAVVVGFMGVPQAGDKFVVMNDERAARDIGVKRQQLRREQDSRKVKLKTLDQISEQIKLGAVKDLNILVKADVDGSAEALADSLIKLNTSEVQVNVIRKAVGPVSENDILLAAASDAVIIGFNIRTNTKAKELAEKEDVDIRHYRVVYDAINEVKLALEGLLEPEESEAVLGQAEVRETFKISRLGVIAGCYVLNGKILRNNKVRLIRDDKEIYSGNIASLKRFKEDTREVASGFECGIQIENYNDLKIGDIIESYQISKVKRHLA